MLIISYFLLLFYDFNYYCLFMLFFLISGSFSMKSKGPLERGQAKF